MDTVYNFLIYYNMKELMFYEVKLGMMPGVLFGMREYKFKTDLTLEKDVVVYFGMFQLILTLVYKIQE